ncbi:hypothetical protein IEQ34_022465 [Dendrobium chrysotoxum]|uniref:Down syndrome critical region protein 3 n=1 Tax=Dendrobium chrysotoxum TaxID=161865 RepID=A0AAV7FK47_DENCH|nr:hypothetical protein IEQ34_022465 [Dendrobium chrysotoxum]
MTIELKLSRSNRVYCLGESVEGKIITIFASPVSYQKIIISLTGTVNLQVKGGVTGVIESLYGVVKPICIIKKSMELATSAGKLGPGRTEINFSFSLSSEKKSGYDMFYETFHGGNISIQYLISADVTRGYLHKALSATLELIVEHNKASLIQAPISPELTSFFITQDTQKHQLLPELSSGRFQVTGNIFTHCSLSEPLSGELIVEASAVPIRSIDIVLLRVESILTGERIISDTSVADGDVCRSMTLPIYVMLPRLLILASKNNEQKSKNETEEIVNFAYFFLSSFHLLFCVSISVIPRPFHFRLIR